MSPRSKLLPMAAQILVLFLSISTLNSRVEAAQIKVINKCPAAVEVAIAYADNKPDPDCSFVDPLTKPPTCIKGFTPVASGATKKIASVTTDCVWLTAYLSTEQSIRWGGGANFDLKNAACSGTGGDCYAWTSLGATKGGECKPLGSDFSWSLECPDNIPLILQQPPIAPLAGPPPPKAKPPPPAAPAPAPDAPLPVVTSPTPTAAAPTPDDVAAQTAVTGGPSGKPPSKNNGTTSGTQTITTSSDDSTNIGLIVGCVVGGVAVLAAVAAGFMLYRKKRKSKDDWTTSGAGGRSSTKDTLPTTYSTKYAEMQDGGSGGGSGSERVGWANGNYVLNNTSKSANGGSKSFGGSKKAKGSKSGLKGSAGSGSGDAAMVAGAAAAGAAALAAPGAYAIHTRNQSGVSDADTNRQTSITSQGTGTAVPDTPGSPRVQWTPSGPYGAFGGAAAPAASAASGGAASGGATPNAGRQLSFTSTTSFNPANDPMLNYLSNTQQRQVATRSGAVPAPGTAAVAAAAAAAAGAGAVAASNLTNSSSTKVMRSSLSQSSGQGDYYERQVDETWAFDWEELDIVKPIGEGGFGKVYAARWKETMVAVKVLLRTADDPEEMLTMSNPVVYNLKKEAILLSTLRHPNIVIFMGICSSPPAIATEYCARGSLMRILSKARKDPGLAAQLTWTRRLNIALDAAKGMLYLHAHNPPIIHRDLKSPNLLVDEHWRAKVTDFNLSRIITDNFYASKSLDATNPRWLAPEVLKGASASWQNDVFAFGVVLWELLTWDLPWGPVQAWSVVASVTGGGRPVLPEKQNLPGPRSGEWPLLDEYVNLMNRCWAQEPAARPHFQHIVVELRRLMEATGGGLSPSDTLLEGNDDVFQHATDVFTTSKASSTTR